MGSYYCKMYIGSKHQRTFGGTKWEVNRILEDYKHNPKYILNDISPYIPDRYSIIKAKFYCYKKNKNGSKKLRKTILIEYFIKNSDGTMTVSLKNVYVYDNKPPVISNKDLTYGNLSTVESPKPWETKVEMSVMTTDKGKEPTKPLKVFLSHNMSGLTESEVMRIRDDAKSKLQERFGEVEVIDNYHHDNAPQDAGRLWHLGASIQQIEESDVVYFCKGNDSSPGCQVEKLICELYGIMVINDESRII